MWKKVLQVMKYILIFVLMSTVVDWIWYAPEKRAVPIAAMSHHMAESINTAYSPSNVGNLAVIWDNNYYRLTTYDNLRFSFEGVDQQSKTEYSVTIWTYDLPDREIEVTQTCIRSVREFLMWIDLPFTASYDYSFIISTPHVLITIEGKNRTGDSSWVERIVDMLTEEHENTAPTSTPAK